MSAIDAAGLARAIEAIGHGHLVVLTGAGRAGVKRTLAARTARAAARQRSGPNTTQPISRGRAGGAIDSRENERGRDPCAQ